MDHIFLTHEENLEILITKDIGSPIDGEVVAEEYRNRIALAMEFRSHVWNVADWSLEGTPIVTTGGPNRYFGELILILVELPTMQDEEVEDDVDEEYGSFTVVKDSEYAD